MASSTQNDSQEPPAIVIDDSDPESNSKSARSSIREHFTLIQKENKYMCNICR